jgi:hypothetical protein
MKARTGQLGQDNQDELAQAGQDSRDRTSGSEQLEIRRPDTPVEYTSLDRSDWTGQRGQGDNDKIA